MRPYWTLNRTKAIVASLAGAGVLTGSVIANKSAFAENTDEVAIGSGYAPEVAMDQGMHLFQPSETHPGYMLPPLSDHLMIAQLNHVDVALEENDGTAKEYNRGYYAEPVPIVALLLAPTTVEAIELSKGGDDGTAQQYDRGYYKDPEIIVALIIVPSEDIEE